MWMGSHKIDIYVLYAPQFLSFFFVNISLVVVSSNKILYSCVTPSTCIVYCIKAYKRWITFFREEKFYIFVRSIPQGFRHLESSAAVVLMEVMEGLVVEEELWMVTVVQNVKPRDIGTTNI